MLNGIVSKILFPYLSKFFEGLDSESLKFSFWSGNIKFFNLKINPKCIEKFKLPFIIKSSSIYNIDIQIDWKSLLSKPKPVIISIDGILVVIHIQPQSQWSFGDSNIYDTKLNDIKTYFSKKLSEISQLKQEKKDNKSNNQGYLANMSTKLIDNIQLKLSNINIMLEDTENTKIPYNFGIKLGKLNIVSTNSKKEPMFIEREKDQTIFYKMLFLEDFGFYLNTNTNNTNNNEIDYILKPITIQCFLKTNNGKDITKENPRYSFYLELKELNIELRKLQYDCIVGILNIISLYSKYHHYSIISKKYLYFKPRNKDKMKYYKEWWRFMIDMIIKEIRFREGDKSVFDIPPHKVEKYKKEFQDKLYDTFLNDKVENIEPSTILKEAIEFIDIEVLYEWMNPIIVKEFGKREKELNTQNSLQSKMGFFSYFTSATPSKYKTNELLTEEEEKEIIRLIEEVKAKFANNENSEKYVISFEYKIELLNGSLMLSNKKLNEKMEMAFTRLLLQGSKYDDNNKYNIIMRKLDIFYIFDDIKKIISTQANNIKKHLIDFSFESKYINNEENKKISLKVETQDILFNNTFINRIVEFFTIKTANWELKEEAKNTLNYMYKSSSSFVKTNVQSHTTKLKIKLAQRKLILPLNAILGKKCVDDSIEFYLGEMLIQSPEQNMVKIVNNEKYNTKLIIEITNIRICICKREMLKNLKGKLLISNHHKRKKNLDLDLNVGGIEIELTKQDYQILGNLNKCFKREDAKEKEKIIKEEEEPKENKINVQSELYFKKNQGIMGNNIEEYYGMLKDKYIMLYNKTRKGKCKHSIFLGNGTKITSTDISKYSIKLENCFNEKYEIRLKKEEHYHQWKTSLQAKITEIGLYSMNNVNSKENEEDEIVDDNEFTFNFSSLLESIKVNIYTQKENLLNKDFAFTFGKSEINISQSNNLLRIYFSLLDTYLYDETTDINKVLISCNQTNVNKSKKFIDITLKLFNINSPQYKQENTSKKLHINIGGIDIIYNPIKINSIINFFKNIDTEEDSKHKKIIQSLIQNENELPLSTSSLLSSSNVIDCIIYKDNFLILTNLELIDITFILPKNKMQFFKVNFTEADLKIKLLFDHYDFSGTLQNFWIYDLTNYPNIITSHNQDVVKQTILGEKSSKASIEFSILLLKDECPLVKNKVTSKVNLQFKGFYMNYIQEQFLRILSYLTEEIILSLTYNANQTQGQEQVQEQVTKQNEEKPESNIIENFDKMKHFELEIKVQNPQLILKQNYTSNDYFIVDFGDLIINNSHYITDDKKYFTNSFQINLHNATITKNDFHLSPSFSSIINIHLLQHCSNILYSYTQIDCIIPKIEVHLRQCDYINLMNCFYKNIIFNDNKSEIFFFDDFNKNFGKRNVLLEHSSTKVNYTNFIFNIIIPNIKITTLINNNLPFSKLTASYIILKIESFSSKENIILFTLDSLSLYENVNINENKYNQILFCALPNENNSCQNNIKQCIPINQKAFEINKVNNKIVCMYKIEANKNVMLYLDIEQMRFIAKFDILYMLYIFFILNMPPSNPLLSNKYRNNCFDFFINIKNPSICLLTDQTENKKQTIIYLTTSLFLIQFKFANEEEGRKVIMENNKREFECITMYFQLKNLSTEYSTLEIFLNNENKQNFISRKLIDNFNISFDVLTKCVFSQSDKNFSYEKTSSLSFEPNINISMSYREFLNILLIKTYEMNLLSNEYINQLISMKPKSQDSLIEKLPSDNDSKKKQSSEEFSFTLNNHNNSISITLINDDNDTLYPFVKIDISSISILYKHLSSKMNGQDEFKIKIKTYNYIAGDWEPLLECASFKIIHYHIDNKRIIILEVFNNKSSNIPNISKLSDFINLNISDLAIEFLYLNLSKWKKNYNLFLEQSDKVLQRKISNYKVFNYSGKKLKLYNDKMTQDILPNNNFSIEYNEDLQYSQKNSNIVTIKQQNKKSNETMQQNIYTFKVEGYDIKKDKINIQNVQKRKVPIEYNKTLKNSPGIQNDYSFITVKVNLHHLKKYVYFYSPLLFENATSTEIKILIDNNKEKIDIILKQDDKFGVPIEFLNGNINITPSGWLKTSLKKTISSLLSSENIIEEIKENDKYIVLFSPKKEDKKEIENRIITIKYPYCIKNCLPFDLKLKTKNTNETIPKGKIHYIDNISVFTDLKVEICISNISNWNTVTLYKYGKKDNLKPKEIELFDKQNNKIIITSLLYDIIKKMIVLYPTRILINLAGENISFYYHSILIGKIDAVPCQTKSANVFILNPSEDAIIIKSNDVSSGKIKLEELGSINDITCGNKSKGKVYKYILESKLSLVDIELDLYCTILTLRAKYVIYNQTKYNIEFSLADSPKTKRVFKIEQRQNFDFFGCDESSLLRIRLIEPNIKDTTTDKNNNYSYPFNLSDNSLHSLQCYKSSDQSYDNIFNISIEKHNEDITTIIVIKDIDENNALIIVENKLKDYNVNLWQKEYKKSQVIVKPLSRELMVWSDPQKARIICIKIPNLMNETQIFVFQDEKINDNKLKYKQSIFELKETKKKIFAEFELEGLQLKITISYEEDLIKSNELEEKFIDSIEVFLIIRAMTINLITDNRNLNFNMELSQYSRNEICLIALNDIQAYLSKHQKNDDVFKSEVSFFIREIKIGNESEIEMIYPMIFYRRYFKDPEIEKYIPMFNMVIQFQYNKKVKMTRMNLFNFSIQEFNLQIELPFALMINNFFNNIIIGTKTAMTELHDIFTIQEYGGTNPKNKHFELKGNHYLLSEQYQTLFAKPNLYIEKIEISSIDVILSIINQSDEKKSFHQINKMLKNIFLALSNIKECDIKLNGLESRKFIGTFKNLFNAIYIHFKLHLQKNIYKIAFGIEILGNLNHIIKTLSEGIKDLYKEPIEGFKQRPLQGIFGIAKGTTSYFSHSIEGIFGGLESTISDISKRFLEISTDAEYIKKRELNKEREKPKNILEGIGYGFKSFGEGVYFGVTDIIRQPIIGAKKDNLEGVATGLLKGIGGLISKPLSGALDFVSKTGEGIKNTMKKEEFKLQDKKLRELRVFYGKYSIIRKYKSKDAKIKKILMTSSKWKEFNLNHINICEIILNVKIDKEYSIMVITTERIVFINKNHMLIDQYVDNKDIIQILLDKDYLVFKVYNKEEVKVYLKENQVNILKLVKKTIKDIDENYEIKNL